MTDHCSISSPLQTDLDHLAKLAGHVPVKIEPIHPERGHFGTAAKRKKVKFGQYLDMLRDEESKGEWYLTTQYEEEEDEEEQEQEDVEEHRSRSATNDSGVKRKRSKSLSVQDQVNGQEAGSSRSGSISSSSSAEDIYPFFDGLPEEYQPEPLDSVLPSPTHALANEFPLQPELMGNLVLQQTNLWLGNCTEGKSSGLHHDFHDNLYALLAGRKRFLLFPPVAFDYLHPRGIVERVFSNGLIEYTPPGQLHVDHPRSTRLSSRPDGMPPSEASRWRLAACRSALEAAYETAAKDSNEAHLPAPKRKGKARMTLEQEEALNAYQKALKEVEWCIESEQLDEAGDVGDEDIDDYSDDDDLDDFDDMDEFDFSDDGYGSIDQEAEFYSDAAGSDDEDEEIRQKIALDTLIKKALDGDARAMQLLSMTKIGQVAAAGLQDDDDDDEDEDDEVNELQDLADGDDDIKGVFDDEDDLYLEIPSKPGNLKGGLRRDDAEDFDEPGEYDDQFAAGGELLMLGGEDGEIFIGGTDDEDDDDDAEAQLAAMAQLRSEVAQRMRDHGRGDVRERGNQILQTHEATGAEGTTSATTTLTDEDDEEESFKGFSDGSLGQEDVEGSAASSESSDDDDDAPADMTAEELKAAKAAILAHIEAGGEVILDDSDQEYSESGSSLSDEEDADLPTFGHTGKRKADSEDESMEDDEDDEETSSDLFPLADGQTEGSDWGGDVEDGEAALEALAAAAEAKKSVSSGQPGQQRSTPAGHALGKFAPANGKAPQVVQAKAQSETNGKAQQEANEPVSFSRIDVATLHQHFGISDSLGKHGKSSHPAMYNLRGPAPLRPAKRCPRPLVAELRPGEMLYLPASWWHEVTSEATPEESDIHMALNWWFHPPDRLEEPKKVMWNQGASKASATKDPFGGHSPDPFHHPYNDGLVWAKIRETVQGQLEAAREAAAKASSKGKGSSRKRHRSD